MRKGFFLMFILLIVSTMFATGTERLVILGFDPMDRDSRTATTALTSRDLNTVFGADDHFKLVIGRDVRNAMVAENIAQNMETLTAHEAGIIGERLEASIVVWGTVVRVSDTVFRMSGSMRSQRTGTTASFSVQFGRAADHRRDVLRTELLPRLHEFSKTEVSKMFDLALQLFHSRLFDSAEESFREIVLIDRTNAYAWFYLGFIQFEQNRFSQAVEFYNQGLAVDPNNERILAGIADAYRRQGLLDQAIQALERLAQTRSDINIYRQIATMYRDRGMIQESLAALDKAIAIDAEFEPVRRLYAEVAYDNQLFERAIEHLLFITELRPDDEESARRLAISFQRTGQLGLAIERYQAIIAADRNNVRAHLNLASAYRAIALENAAEATRYNRLALQAFMDARRIDDQNPRIEISISDVHLALNDLTNAERFANAARQKQANLHEATTILATIAQRRGIERYNSFVELQGRTESGNYFGSELDGLIGRRDTTRREAHAFFNQSGAFLRESLANADNDRTRNDINRRIQENQQYINLTMPDFFD